MISFLIFMIIVGFLVIVGGILGLKDKRHFDYSDIADIIEAEAYLDKIKIKKKK